MKFLSVWFFEAPRKYRIAAIGARILLAAEIPPYFFLNLAVVAGKGEHELLLQRKCSDSQLAVSAQ